ncbi:MAG TPA: divergent PAP2 family protein [Chloroflexota bacterium]
MDVGDLLANRVLVVSVMAWALAQVLKVLIYVTHERKVNLRYLASSGGMPSSHSALVTALATAVAVTAGPRSPLFAMAAVFAAVVMYDAAGVRQSVSIQARILNRMLDEIFVEHAFNEKRLRELIGHTPVEVFVGAVLGFVVAVVFI